MEEENKMTEEQVSAETNESSVAGPVEDAASEIIEKTEECVESAEQPEETAETSVEAEKEAETDEDGKKPMSKKKRIINAILLGIQIAFVVVAITICLVMLLNPKAQDEISPLGVKLLPVQSDSMKGDKKDNFVKGDLIIAHNVKNGGEGLTEGTIITFKMLEETRGVEILVTHRIHQVITENGFTQYITKGDNNALPDKTWLQPKDVLAVYSFHIKGLGAVIDWIRDGFHFIYVIIIPLGLLLIYNIYLVAQIVVEAKMKKAKETAAATARSNLSEEDLLRLMQERGIDTSALQAQMQNSAQSDKKEGDN